MDNGPIDNGPMERGSIGTGPPESRSIDIDRLFHALGDGTRRAILDRLTEGPVSVSALAEMLGITLTAVGQHLLILEESGLAHTHKLGRVRTCRLGTEGFTRLDQWVREHRTVWQRRLDRLGDLLEDAPE
jgi:DNA-binding transcriptional ArsR family regulator